MSYPKRLVDLERIKALCAEQPRGPWGTIAQEIIVDLVAEVERLRAENERLQAGPCPGSKTLANKVPYGAMAVCEAECGICGRAVRAEYSGAWVVDTHVRLR